MQCDEFETRLNDLLDARTAPEADMHLQAHADICNACSRLLRGQALLLQGLDAFDLPSPSADFAQQTVARAKAKGLIYRWVMAAAALAAALLLAISVWRNAPETAANSHMTPQTPSLPPGSDLDVHSPAINAPQFANTRTDAQSITNNRQSPEEYRAMLRDLFEEIGQFDDIAAPETLAGVDQFAGGLRPIASSFTAAFDALRKTIPGAKPAHRAEKPQADVRRGLWGALNA